MWITIYLYSDDNQTTVWYFLTRVSYTHNALGFTSLHGKVRTGQLATLQHRESWRCGAMSHRGVERWVIADEIDRCVTLHARSLRWWQTRSVVDLLYKIARVAEYMLKMLLSGRYYYCMTSLLYGKVLYHIILYKLYLIYMLNNLL